MSNRTVKVILEANATGLIAGFRAAKGEVASFSASASKNSQAMDDMGRKAAGMGTQTSAGAAAAAASMSQLSGATKGTYGAVNTLGSGMKAGAGSINTLSTATLAARGGLSTLGQTAVTQSSLASGGLKTMGGAAQSAGAAAAAASGGLRTLGSSATTAGKGTLVASGGLKAAGSSAAGIGTSAAAAAGGLKAVGTSAAGVSSGALAASGGLKAVSSSAAGVSSGALAASGGLKAVGSSAAGVGSGATAAASGLNAVGGAAAAAGAGAASAKGGLDGVGSAAKGASSNATAAATGFGRLSGSIRENNSEWSDLSTKAVIAGGAIAGGLGVAAKAAIDWESAWAGVQKTNDGNAQQMAKLEGELRNLAKTLPATHAEIAGVAEAAGQLGIERENVAQFTKTMIDMGESTNLSAEDAATAIARFSNVMGTAQTDASRIGSAIVELGNNFATTENEIMQMSLRLTGAGRQANMTEGDILGIATAMSSVGIEAQAGGTAMSRVITEMGKSVDTGNEKLEAFARTAGMSSEAFSKLWQENSGEAMQRFIAGLGEMQARGESLEPTLAELGMTDIRVGDALRRSASASDQFTAAMETGNEAYKANTALAAEAAVRYETNASKIAVAGNRIKDAMIDVGASVAPALARGAEAVAGLAEAFSGLPPQARNAVTGVAAFTGAGLLIGGMTVKAIAGIQTLKSSLDTIGVATKTAEGDLTRVGRAVQGMSKWGGYALGAAAVVTALGNIIEAGREAPASIEQMTAALLDMNEAGSTVTIDKEFGRVGDSVKVLGVDMSSSVDGIKGAFDRLNDPSNFQKFDDLNGIIPGVTSHSDRLRDSFKTTGESLAAMPAEQAARQFDLMTEAIGGGEENAKKLLELMPAYRDQLQKSENDARMAGDGAAAMGGDLEGMGDSADTAADAVADLSDEIKGLGDTLLQQEASYDGWEAALDAVDESLKENGRTLDATTEAGRANREALRDLATSTQEWAAAELEAGAGATEVQGILDRGRDKWVAHRDALGENKRETRELADALFTLPEDAVTEVEAKGAAEATAATEKFNAMVTGIPAEKGTNVSAPGAKMATDETGQFKGMVDGVPTAKATRVSAPGAKESGREVSDLKGLIGALTGKKVNVKEEGAKPSTDRVKSLDGNIAGLKNKDVTVKEQGAKASSGRVRDLRGIIGALNGKTVNVKEQGAKPSSGRVSNLTGLIGALNGKTVEVKETGADPSKGRVQGLDGAIRGTNGKSMDVRANVHGKWDVDGLRGSINATRSKTVTVTAVRRIKNMFADGGMLEGGVQTFADGGFASIGSQRPQIRSAGGAGITWAEAGAGPWEAFISGHPAKKKRSEQIWMETGRRLGMLEAHADGAVRQYARPAPPARHYVAPQPRVQLQAPVPAAMESGPSAAEMRAAIEDAFAGVKITTNINGRDFQGVLDRTRQDRRSR